MSRKNLIDTIKVHTIKKIEFVSDYTHEWLNTICRFPKTKEVNFIDCMCNCGHFYDDNNNLTEGTCINVLKFFIRFSMKSDFKHINFNLFLNDYDEERINYLKEIIDTYSLKKIDNLNIFISCADVNECIENISNSFNRFLGKDSCGFTLLYVDPYNLGTVNIEVVKTFLDRNYAELIYNCCTNDFVRNTSLSTVEKNSSKIRNALCPIFVSNEDLTQITSQVLLNRIAEYLKTSTFINHAFRYLFKNSKNSELYYIVFATPSPKGIEKLKVSLWSVFNGVDYYKQPKNHIEQTSMFTVKDSKQMTAEKHARIDKEKIYEKFKESTINYDTIKLHVEEYTMLKDGQIIEHILKPLICDGLVKKTGRKNSYRKEKYTFK